MASGGLDHLRADLGSRHFEGEDTIDANPILMHVQHYASSGFTATY